ncbi:MAG: RimJ/RimL family protein N-acetyltransferase [Bacteroidetes bacterium]|nr:MAG: RimJ/RimL family protein N-acetyltransferase [Bacteroidota bacterium]
MLITETQRLFILKVTLKDAPFFVELMNTPSWLKYIGDRHIKTVEDAENNLKNGILKSYQESGYGFYKVVQKSAPEKAMGIAGLVKRKELEHTDIGFGFLPEFESKGYGYEASEAIMKLAKDRFKLKTVLAITNPENKSSIHLLEKLGLSYQKRIKPFDDNEELLLFAKDLL